MALFGFAKKRCGKLSHVFKPITLQVRIEKKVCYDRELSEPFFIKRKKEVKKSDKDGNRKEGKEKKKKKRGIQKENIKK